MSEINIFFPFLTFFLGGWLAFGAKYLRKEYVLECLTERELVDQLREVKTRRLIAEAAEEQARKEIRDI